jgi:isochorismate synthase
VVTLPILAGVCQELAPIDPFQTDLARSLETLWAHPDRGELLAGFGCAVALAASGSREVTGLVDKLGSSKPIRWLGPGPQPDLGAWMGGVAFDIERPSSGVWSGFPSARFTIPEILFVSDTGGTLLCALAPMSSPALGMQSRLERRLEQARQRLEARSPPRREHPRPAVEDSDRGAWERLVSRALESIAAGTLRKVVLARALRLASPGGFDPVRTLEALRRSHPTAHLFLTTASDGSRFLGASPEQLVRLRGREFHTEALAGTAPASAPEDQLFSPKNLEEHEWVVQALVEALAPLSERLLRAASPGAMSLRGLKHLKTPFEAVLRENVSLADLLVALHPTPATGGSPRMPALDFLRRHEGWPRGWYAGAVGCLGPGRADLAVGIRSALLRDEEAWIFAGAGIVAGSTPDGEWRETALKSQTMLGALGATRPETERAQG